MSDKEIQEAAEELFKGTEYPVPNIYCFTNGAKWALSHQWVSVKDKLPEKPMYVLVNRPTSGNTDLFYVEYFAYGVFSGELDQNNNSQVTHWMPIPPLSLPKTNTDKND